MSSALAALAEGAKTHVVTMSETRPKLSQAGGCRKGGQTWESSKKDGGRNTRN